MYSNPFEELQVECTRFYFASTKLSADAALRRLSDLLEGKAALWNVEIRKLA